MMRGLLLSSAACLLFTGCTSLGYHHYRKLKEVPANLTTPKPIFGDNFNSFLFKTNITIYGKEVSGLLVTKQMEPKDYRVIFTTELGMKLFDFEFKETSFTLHYCVPQFNRPKLLKTIKEDIEILLMNNLEGKPMEGVSARIENRTEKGIKIRHGKYSDNYFFAIRDSSRVCQIEHFKRRRLRVNFILYDYYEDKFPNDILIQHNDIKLEIRLKLLKK